MLCNTCCIVFTIISSGAAKFLPLFVKIFITYNTSSFRLLRWEVSICLLAFNQKLLVRNKMQLSKWLSSNLFISISNWSTAVTNSFLKFFMRFDALPVLVSEQFFILSTKKGTGTPQMATVIFSNLITLNVKSFYFYLFMKFKHIAFYMLCQFNYR